MLIQQSRIPYLPARIEGLAAIAMNLWWSWSREARALFHSIDEALWRQLAEAPRTRTVNVYDDIVAGCPSGSVSIARRHASRGSRCAVIRVSSRSKRQRCRLMNLALRSASASAAAP